MEDKVMVIERELIEPDFFQKRIAESKKDILETLAKLTPELITESKLEGVMLVLIKNDISYRTIGFADERLLVAALIHIIGRCSDSVEKALEGGMNG